MSLTKTEKRIVKPSLRELALQATTLSRIMLGKTKGETKELIDYCADNKSVKINDVEFVTQSDDVEYWVYTVEEDDEHFYFAGTVLRNTFSNILGVFMGDFETMAKEFSKEPLEVIFKESEKTPRQGESKTTIIEIV